MPDSNYFVGTARYSYNSGSTEGGFCFTNNYGDPLMSTSPKSNKYIYLAVVTVDSKVKLVMNEECTKDDVLGTENCPYKLECTEC